MSAAPDVSLSVKLTELTGIDDETVDRLAVLARDGSITAASAVRLAMRHADECRSAQPRRRQDVDGAAAYELALAGDPFGRFAFRLRGRKAWVVFAPTVGVGLLAELCLRDQIQACLLIGCGAGRRTTVRLLTSADWRRRIAVVGAGSNRCGSHHVLLLGGLALWEPEWSSALLGIEQAIRRGGNTELISSSFRKLGEPDRSIPIAKSLRELLTLIELAFPGLVGIPTREEGIAP